MTETRAFLERHLQAIFDSDLETYHATTVPELTLYEWYITPSRIDGIPFHDFMMTEAARSGATPLTGAALRRLIIARTISSDRAPTSTWRITANNTYGDTAIACYTLLISQGTREGVKVTSYNESRIIVKFPDGLKVVHVHKSPSWNASFQPK